MQILDPLKNLQPYHQHSLQTQSTPASRSQRIDVVTQLLHDQISPSVFLKGLLDFWEAVVQGLFDKLVAIYLILRILAITDAVGFGDQGMVVAGQASLEALVVGFFDDLEDLVLVLDHG